MQKFFKPFSYEQKNQIELRKQQNQSENIQAQKCLIAILH